MKPTDNDGTKINPGRRRIGPLLAETIGDWRTYLVNHICESCGKHEPSMVVMGCPDMECQEDARRTWHRWGSHGFCQDCKKIIRKVEKAQGGPRWGNTGNCRMKIVTDAKNEEVREAREASIAACVKAFKEEMEG